MVITLFLELLISITIAAVTRFCDAIVLNISLPEIYLDPLVSAAFTQELEMAKITNWPKRGQNSK